MEQIHQIPLEQLHDSQFNPRRIFAGIEELAADIRSHGQIFEPLLVRPRLTNPLRDDIVDGYEIVFGHRRRRGAELAGLPTAPCMVRSMDEDEARRAQISENLARNDVHPIEEAEGFQALIEHGGRSADDLAADFGKSRSYVYGRLKLLQACPRIREACLEGRIGSEVALLIARLRTEKLQEKALGYIVGKFLDLEDGGRKSYRQVRELLLERFTLELKLAIFDPGDALLVPEAGTCGDCPKRAGNAPEFADAAEGCIGSWGRKIDGDPNVCTDPDCFEVKKRAHLHNQAAAMASAGQTVVEGAKARQAIGADGAVKGAYVALKDVRGALSKAKAAAKKDATLAVPQVVVIQDPRTGKTVEAVKVSELQAAVGIEAVEAATEKKKARGQHDWEKERREREEQAKAETAANVERLKRVFALAKQAPRSADDLRLVVAAALEGVEYDYEDIVADLWGRESIEALQAAVADMDVDSLALLLLSVPLCEGLRSSGYGRNVTTWLDRAEVIYATTPSKAARAKKKARGSASTPADNSATSDTRSGADTTHVEAASDHDPNTADLFTRHA